jgi:hypothetical protein
MAVIAKVIHTSFIGFVLGAGFSLFTYVDDGMRIRGSTTSPSLAVDRPSRFRAAVSAAGAEGVRTAVIIGAASAAMGSAALARHGAAGASDRAIWSDAIAVGTGVGVGVWVSALPALASPASSGGGAAVAIDSGIAGFGPRVSVALTAAVMAAGLTHFRFLSLQGGEED